MSTTEPQTATGGFQLDVTDRAADEVRKFMDAESVSPESAGLRVAVLPGGCSGFKYSLNIEEQSREDDMVVPANGIRLFIDGFSAPYLDGHYHRLHLNHAGIGVHLQQPQRHRWMRLRRELHRLTRRRSVGGLTREVACEPIFLGAC